MILLVNPRATRPSNRRFPLSVMAIGAALPSDKSWEIVDGNLPGMDPLAAVSGWVERQAHIGDPVEAVALTVMPGPQLVSAVRIVARDQTPLPEASRSSGAAISEASTRTRCSTRLMSTGWSAARANRPSSISFEVIDGKLDPHGVAGLGFRESDGSHFLAPERTWAGPDDLPDPPYHKINVADYLHPTFLGRRSGVYQASIGCPFGCNFCGVIAVFGRREKVQSPTRVARNLEFLVRTHGMDSVHFYDNNFFLNERHAREIAAAMRHSASAGGAKRGSTFSAACRTPPGARCGRRD